MKKQISLLMVMALLFAVAMPVAAEEFVPSISYKDHPDVVGVPEIIDGETRETLDSECIEITPVSDALDTPVEDRDPSDALLVEVYEKLTNGDMKLPIPGTDADEEKYYVVRDLLDVSMICDDVHTDPDHVGELEKPDVFVEIVFDLGVKEDKEVTVLVYLDGEWHPIEGVTNNGDGTITCIFEDLCPVAFCVEDEGKAPAPPTRDKLGQDLLLWVILMIVSSGAAITMLACQRKIRR